VLSAVDTNQFDRNRFRKWFDHLIRGVLMSAQLLIYGSAVPISKERHGKWSVQVGADYHYTKNLNALPLLAAEFISAAREYPIVFSRANDAVAPVALLSMRDEENLFLTESNQWTAQYIPAFLRRYPFVFSRSDDGKTFTLCIDELFTGFNQDGKGERLFSDSGEVTPFVNNVLQFLQTFQAENARTQEFCRKLDELELFESQNAVWTGPGGERVALTGFLCVSREKLKAIPPKMLQGMIGSGEMDLLYAHLFSLNNFNLFKSKMASR
jgi:hypothetical protein